MGADLHTNPPEEKKYEVWELVKAMQEELSDKRQEVHDLRLELRDAQEKIASLRHAIKTFKEEGR